MQTFNPGDVVRLRSGSPWFTVEAVDVAEPHRLQVTRFDYGDGFTVSEHVLPHLMVKRSWFEALTSF